MKLYPAIDLRNGQVVRLTQGDYDKMTVYGTDPCAQARQFVAAGAKYLHVVDLDGAKDGTLSNYDTIAALAKQGTALVLSVVVMLAAFVGFGGAKVRGKYNEARQWFTTGVSADNGYALSEELTTRANTAANIITTGANTLGADSAEVQAAQAGLDDFSACLEAVQNGSKKQSLTSLPYYQGSAMHALCQANEALGTVIDQLYAKMQEQAADPMKMGAVQGQYGQFNSADTIIGNLQYNDAVYEYQNDVGGFPASMLGRLFGVQEVEPFA